MNPRRDIGRGSCSLEKGNERKGRVIKKMERKRTWDERNKHHNRKRDSTTYNRKRNWMKKNDRRRGARLWKKFETRRKLDREWEGKDGRDGPVGGERNWGGQDRDRMGLLALIYAEELMHELRFTCCVFVASMWTSVRVCLCGCVNYEYVCLKVFHCLL